MGRCCLSSSCICDAVAYLPLCGFCYGIVSGALLALTGMAVPMYVCYQAWYNVLRLHGKNTFLFCYYNTIGAIYVFDMLPVTHPFLFHSQQCL